MNSGVRPPSCCASRRESRLGEQWPIVILWRMTKFSFLLRALLATGILSSGGGIVRAEDSAGSIETIVVIRHGEKPANDLGQLNVQGLNRALALPDVLAAKFGKPDFIFAPLPKQRLEHTGESYSYIRPLMTIEPTAIRLGMPIDARFVFTNTDRLQRELLKHRYEKSLIFVAWEHHLAEKFAKDLLVSLNADATVVPEWPPLDFDSIYVLKISTENGKKTVAFTHDHEGLDGLGTEYPHPQPKGK